jgi:hypothetical protein
VRSGQLPPVPNAIGAAPVVAGQSIAHSGQLPLPNAVAAAPLVTDRNATRDAGGRAAPELIAVAKPPARMFPEETRQLPSAPIRQNPAARVVLPPMQDVAAAATGAAAGSTPHAPVVTYSDGQLTINAENITLAAVLQLIAEKTGALIEVPPGTGLERIFEHTGPGRAEDVLASLLNGSSFDFVIVGSPQRPHVPTQVLLTLHGTDDTVASAPSQPSRPTAPATSWTPPDAGPAIVVPQELDSKNLEPPKEPLSGDALDKLMKDRTKQLRERLQEQQQQQ